MRDSTENVPAARTRIPPRRTFARIIVGGAHQSVSEVVYRHDRTIAQLLGDGVRAFFGAPTTHEDDPIRAINAALDLLNGMHD
jgi:class 3 adenylate cyclase